VRVRQPLLQAAIGLVAPVAGFRARQLAPGRLHRRRRAGRRGCGASVRRLGRAAPHGQRRLAQLGDGRAQLRRRAMRMNELRLSGRVLTDG